MSHSIFFLKCFLFNRALDADILAGVCASASNALFFFNPLFFSLLAFVLVVCLR